MLNRGSATCHSQGFNYEQAVNGICDIAAAYDIIKSNTEEGLILT